MMLDLEQHAEFSNHNIVEVGTIVSDNPFRDAVPTDEVMFDKSGYKILGN